LFAQKTKQGSVFLLFFLALGLRLAHQHRPTLELVERLEEEAKKPAAERKLPEFGTDKDFQLTQALNKLKGRAVLVSKTQTERKEEKKEN
jgi:hypothetical protein